MEKVLSKPVLELRSAMVNSETFWNSGELALNKSSLDKTVFLKFEQLW